MSDLELIDEFINAFATQKNMSNFVEIIDKRMPLGLGFGHILALNEGSTSNWGI